MEEEEIDLMDYFIVLRKRWKGILFLTIAFTIVSSIVIFLMPNIYQSNALISPAIIEKKALETPFSLEIVLKNPSGIYLKDIAKGIKFKGKSLEKLATMFDVQEKAEYLSVLGRGDTPENARNLTAVVSGLILKRQNDLIQDALNISNNEIQEMDAQYLSMKDEVIKLNEKIVKKDKMESTAQSYMFRSLIIAREGTLDRQVGLLEDMTKKKIEAKYFTKMAFIVGEATIPETKIAPKRTKIIFATTFIGFMLSILISIFRFEYFKKEDIKNA